MQLFTAYFNGLINTFNIKDRATRSDYWYFSLMTLIVLISTAFIWDKLFAAYVLLTVPASFSIILRRLNDAGRSKLLILVSLIPMIGSFWMIYFLCLPSQNSYSQKNSPAFA